MLVQCFIKLYNIDICEWVIKNIDEKNKSEVGDSNPESAEWKPSSTIYIHLKLVNPTSAKFLKLKMPPGLDIGNFPGHYHRTVATVVHGDLNLEAVNSSTRYEELFLLQNPFL